MIKMKTSKAREVGARLFLVSFNISFMNFVVLFLSVYFHVKEALSLLALQQL